MTTTSDSRPINIAKTGHTNTLVLESTRRSALQRTGLRERQRVCSQNFILCASHIAHNTMTSSVTRNTRVPKYEDLALHVYLACTNANHRTQSQNPLPLWRDLEASTLSCAPVFLCQDGREGEEGEYHVIKTCARRKSAREMALPRLKRGRTAAQFDAVIVKRPDDLRTVFVYVISSRGFRTAGIDVHQHTVQSTRLTAKHMRT